MSYLERAKSLYAQRLLSEYGTPVGADTVEIERLERRMGVMFPDAYREYLLWIGRDTQGMFRGTDCFIQHVEENTSYLPELLQENGVSGEVTKASVAFFCHQGYQIAWFNADKSGPDPLCFFFSEAHGFREPPLPLSALLFDLVSSVADDPAKT